MRDGKSLNLNEESFRIMEIQAEIVSSIDRLQHIDRAIGIFGSARMETSDSLYHQCMELSTQIAAKGFYIISGGGGGVMEAANRGAYPFRKSIGFNIDLPKKEQGNSFLNHEFYFRHFFVRKYLFAKMCQAFIFFPGGFGTLDELFTIATLIQTGKNPEAPFILYNSKHWLGMLDWVRKEVQNKGFIAENEWKFFKLADSIEECIKIVTY